MNSRSLNDIKAEAFALGFYACGTSKVSAVAKVEADKFRATLEAGGFADMDYLSRNIEKRLDPTLLMPGAKSIISVALNYTPEIRIPNDRFQIATYAYGKDYHDAMKQRLHQLANTLGLKEYRVFCDTAPVLERYWAVMSGIGWIGRNHQLIVPGAGSRVFLGEIITDEELEYNTEILISRCGDCKACIESCPTMAIGGQSAFDASRCLSYQTIENRNDIPMDIADKMGDCFYGCDRCIDACPWNRTAEPTKIPEFLPSEALLNMTNEDWKKLDEDDYRRLFKGSAVKRAKYSGLTRNIKLLKD